MDQAGDRARAIKLIVTAEKLLEEVLPPSSQFHKGKLTLCKAYLEVKHLPEHGVRMFKVRFQLAKLDSIMIQLVRICFAPAIMEMLALATEEIDFTDLDMYYLRHYIAWYSAFTPITSEKILAARNAYRAHESGDMTQNALAWNVYRDIIVKAMTRMIAANDMNVNYALERFHVNPTFRPNIPPFEDLLKHMVYELIQPPSKQVQKSFFSSCTIS
jgi:hypothetical protein